MNIRKHQKGTKKLSDIPHHFSELNTKLGSGSYEVKAIHDNAWTVKDAAGNIVRTDYDFSIGFFGKSGYGKSSLVNILLDDALMETSDVDACTRHCNYIEYEISESEGKKSFLSFCDFPGIGEDVYRNDEYMKMYSDFMRTLGLVVYVVRADTRDYSIDEQAYEKIFNTPERKQNVIIALNFCDKIEPISRQALSEPTPEQMRNIEEKVRFIQNKFNPGGGVVPCSSGTGWNIQKLAETITQGVLNSPAIQCKIGSFFYPTSNPTVAAIINAFARDLSKKMRF